MTATFRIERRGGVGAALVFALALAVPAFSAVTDPGSHSLIRFWFDPPAETGTEVDEHLFPDGLARGYGLAGGTGEYVDIVVRREEVAALLDRGSRVEVLVTDFERDDLDRDGHRDIFGVYHTYDEGATWLDQLAADYPEVVSPKWSLGATHEGRSIWCVRVSDNPTTDEPEEPEVLFTGLGCAKYVMSSEMVLMLTAYFAEQSQAGNPEIVQLIQENEIYLVPFVNPDGFVYNERTHPEGGGSWMKNRRDNGDGTYGVSLNSNYPYEWGCSYGSSGDPSSDYYRGPFAGSEPEVQALMQFIDSRDFAARLSLSSGYGLMYFPWSYTNVHSPDHATFVELAAVMTRFNAAKEAQGYEYGPACGTGLDWSYGQQDSHTKIFCFSLDVGLVYWPDDASRQPLFDANLWPCLYLTAAASDLRGPSFTHEPLDFLHPSAGPQDLTVVVEGFGGVEIDPASVVLSWRLDGGAWVERQLLPTGNPGEFGGTLSEIPGDEAVVDYYISAADIDGHLGTTPRTAPDVWYTYEIGTSFAHDMEADRGWTVGAPDDSALHGFWVRVDPVGTVYNGNPVQPEDDHSDTGDQCWITGQHSPQWSVGYNDVDKGKTTLYSPVYDMTGGQTVAVRYWRWFSNDQYTNPSEDYWDVDISNDGGQTWTSVEHTRTAEAAWTERQVMVTDYFARPERVQLRFVARDEGGGSIVEAGVDDFLIVGDFDVTGTPDDQPQAALEADLGAAPNPFNPLTTLRFRVPIPGATELGVFDLHGRLVKSLVREILPAGDHTVSWSGCDALGRPVASGVYFVRLLTPDGDELSRKLVLAR